MTTKIAADKETKRTTIFKSFSLLQSNMLVNVLFIVLVAVLIRALFPKTLPYPYEAIPIRPLDEERVQRIQKASQFSKSGTYK